MKPFHRLLPGLLCLALLLLPGAAGAQGVRMSADFFPLAPGNRWTYDVFDESGRKVREVNFSVREYTIVGGRSFYVLEGAPFFPDGVSDFQFVRYDREGRQFLWLFEDRELPLFPDDAITEVLQADSAGLPQRFSMQGARGVLTFQRGVGIVEGRLQDAVGQHVLSLTDVRLAGLTASADTPGAVPAAGAAGPSTVAELPGAPANFEDNIAAVGATNPRLELRSTPSAQGRQLTLIVANSSDKLLPFDFASSQDYDFIVTDAVTGREVWRWSRRMVFGRVVRSEAIRAGGNWTFQAVWNLRDNDANPLPPGRYVAVGILSAVAPLRSAPITIDVP